MKAAKPSKRLRRPCSLRRDAARERQHLPQAIFRFRSQRSLRSGDGFVEVPLVLETRSTRSGIQVLRDADLCGLTALSGAPDVVTSSRELPVLGCFRKPGSRVVVKFYGPKMSQVSNMSGSAVQLYKEGTGDL